MKGIRSRFRLRSWTWLLVVGAALRAAPAVAAVPPPSAPAASTGSYTVSYTRCTCTSDWLEERTEGGAWRVVGKGDVKFTGKAAGTYYYRVGYWWSITDIYVNYQWMEYSTEVRVVVNPNAPPIDSLETQLTYRYETRVGDANGDGVRDGTQDEFVEIVNSTGGTVDISGWELHDGNSTRHVFEPGTVIANEGAIVVFGGIWGIWGLFFAIPLATLVNAVLKAWFIKKDYIIKNTQQENQTAE